MPTHTNVSRPGRARLALLVVALLAGQALRAQQAPPRGRIQGEIADSVHARPLAGALVMLTRLGPEPVQYFNTTTDDKGRFRFDTLSAGRYSLGFAAFFLDSIDLALPSREVILAEGERVRIDLATPSGTVLRAAACPGLALPSGIGAVVGQVVDAETELPMSDARVAVQWTDLSVDKATLRVDLTPRSGAVTTDSLGRYRLCGVPTGQELLVQVQMREAAGNAIVVVIDDSMGVALRLLSLSAASARPLAAASAAAADTLPLPALSGTAILAGVVRGPGRLPVAGAEVRIVDAATRPTHTDSLGRFELSGLPAGTQMGEVRKIGYFVGRGQVELRGQRTVSWDVQLSRVVSLDSIRIVAQRSRYREFESHRKSGWGTFFDEQAIEARHPLETSDLVRMMNGVRIIGYGYQARAVSSRGSGLSGPCAINVVIDGIPNQDINTVSPSDLGAVEVYASATTAPPEYAGRGCGVIVIWTKRGERRSTSPP